MRWQFDGRDEYLSHLDGLIRQGYGSRAAFCRRYGIGESGLSYWLSGKKRLQGVEGKALKALGLRKSTVFTLDRAA